ncbi:MAG: hypothetical protein U1E56_02585 [Bauldia sp.]
MRSVAVVGAALALLALTLPAAAQRTVSARSGQPVVVDQAHACNRVMPQPSAGAEHGTTQVVAITVVSCGRNDQPAWRVIYTSAPGYKGPDTVNVHFSQGQGHTINVMVR